MKSKLLCFLAALFTSVCLVGCGGGDKSSGGGIEPTPEQRKSMNEGMEKYQKKAKQ